MIDEMLKKVRSPFTDELIQDLIKKYISYGCDDKLLYRQINNVEMNDNSIDGFTSDLVNKMLYKQAEYQAEPSGDWVILSSEKDPMGVNTVPKSPLIYRIYLNLKGQEKAEFVQSYIERCQETQMPFQFKFSKYDSRPDQIIILSRVENFEENILTIEELTENTSLGNVPKLVGEYKEGIGVAEEYYDKSYSPTSARLSLLRSSIKKYLCDHKDEFYDELSDDDKERIDKILSSFEKKSIREIERIERLGQNYVDRKRHYQRKSTLDRLNEHAENCEEAQLYGPVLLELGSVIKRLYSKKPEEFIDEVTKNYRMIGTQIWGFSKDFVFSVETEEKFLAAKESETKIPADENTNAVNEEEIKSVLIKKILTQQEKISQQEAELDRLRDQKEK